MSEHGFTGFFWMILPFMVRIQRVLLTFLITVGSSDINDLLERFESFEGSYEFLSNDDVRL